MGQRDLGCGHFSQNCIVSSAPLSLPFPPRLSKISNTTHSGYYSPPLYEDSHYTLLSKGSYVNATHYKVTAKCTGCSTWGDDDIGFTQLDPAYQTTLAFAYSDTPVDTPEDVESTFGIHDSLGHPIYDLAVAKNADFDAKVEALA